jgi:hypothetical protein
MIRTLAAGGCSPEYSPPPGSERRYRGQGRP